MAKELWPATEMPEQAGQSVSIFERMYAIWSIHNAQWYKNGTITEIYNNTYVCVLYTSVFTITSKSEIKGLKKIFFSMPLRDVPFKNIFKNVEDL